MISGHSNMLARGGIVIHLKRDECVEIDCIRFWDSWGWTFDMQSHRVSDSREGPVPEEFSAPRRIWTDARTGHGVSIDVVQAPGVTPGFDDA